MKATHYQRPAPVSSHAQALDIDRRATWYVTMASLLVLLWFALFAAPAYAQHKLFTHDGTVVHGKFVGATENTLVMQVDGTTKIYPMDDVEYLDFGSSEAPATATTEPVVPGSSAVSATLPAGSRLLVHTGASLKTGQTRSGDRFFATLESDLVVDGTVVAPKGATVYGRVVKSKRAGNLTGHARLELALTDIAIHGELHPLVTKPIILEGASSTSKTLKTTGAGAIIGGIFDGLEGAVKGVAIGGGVALLTRGQQLEIPAGTILEFWTAQPLYVSR